MCIGMNINNNVSAQRKSTNFLNYLEFRVIRYYGFVMLKSSQTDHTNLTAQFYYMACTSEKHCLQERTRLPWVVYF